ncbi:ribosome biogenesis protein NOP53 [Diachasma alloeum]|uniref:ribosome biogenesis protein NOP53 n=1 Tax=Diachasma alloeum TaxID=454923 RepID=UPI0007383D17|nr:ribosome biogenesis protein NOP53 [Diachasma alloeum]
MTDVIKKRKRVSKKTKKSWRKHVDTKDVDSFLDDSRLEERLGTPFKKRADTDLFLIDSTPNEDLKTVIDTKAAYREALRNSEPKCYAALKPHTAVPDPISKRNRVKTPEERKNPITKKFEQLRKLSGKLTLTERLAVKNRKLAEIKRKNRPKRDEFKEDIWDDEPKKKVLGEIDTQWLTADAVRHTLIAEGIGKRRVPLAVHRKQSEVPSIEVPHPGTSYNPSYNDHQSLLREIADKELKLMKEEAHLERVTTKMFNKVSQKEKDENWLKDASEGLPLPQDVEAKSEPEDDEDVDVKPAKLPVKNVKKTRVQRRKQKEQRKLALELKAKKVEKKKIGDMYKLKSIEKNIQGQERKNQVLREMRKKAEARKAKEPKVLSRTKFEPAEEAFKLGLELTGNLRGSEPVGNLLKERFKSMQQRNILAPAKLVLKRNKPKVKKFIKPDHKITVPSNSK